MISSGLIFTLGGSFIGTLICSRIKGIGFLISIMLLTILLAFLHLICILCIESVVLEPLIIGCIRPKDLQESCFDPLNLFMEFSFLMILFPV